MAQHVSLNLASYKQFSSQLLWGRPQFSEVFERLTVCFRGSGMGSKGLILEIPALSFQELHFNFGSITISPFLVPTLRSQGCYPPRI